MHYFLRSKYIHKYSFYVCIHLVLFLCCLFIPFQDKWSYIKQSFCLYFLSKFLSSFDSDHFSLVQNSQNCIKHKNLNMFTKNIFNFSAGVGRTGVFISLSIVLERMQYEGVVDVFQTVRTLRTQRPAMVQTEVNCFFIFCCFKYFFSRTNISFVTEQL